MADFRATGRMAVPDAVWRAIRREFVGFTLSDEATLAQIRLTHATTGYLADPHTAIGLAAAAACGPVGMPVIVAATAHPAKFPDAVQAATGIRPPLPPHLAGLYERREKYLTGPNDLGAMQTLVRNFARRNG
jgi:threonine synthase